MVLNFVPHIHQVFERGKKREKKKKILSSACAELGLWCIAAVSSLIFESPKRKKKKKFHTTKENKTTCISSFPKYADKYADKNSNIQPQDPAM